MTTGRLWFVFLAILLSVSDTRAWAKIQVTEFKDAVAQSESIAIAKFVEFPKGYRARGKNRPSLATLEVLRVLQGSLRVGKQDVNFDDVPEGGSGEFVAFLDKDRVWRFSAVPLKGKKVDSELLLISGFDNHDAHEVTPDLITLAQLTTYLKDGTLRYSFSGPLWFPQRGKKAWKPGSLRIKGTYDAVKNSAHVTGLGKLAGFPAEPVVAFNHDSDPSLSLQYSDEAHRPLNLIGMIEGLDPKTGIINARFAVVEPNVLTQADLEKYLADTRLGHCYYSFRLRCAPAKEFPQLRDLSLTLQNEIGTIGTVEGWERGPLGIASSSFDGPTEHTGSATAEVPAAIPQPPEWVLRLVIPTTTGDLVLDFEIGKPSNDKDVLRWTFQSDLLYRAYSGPVRGTLQLYDGKKLRTVTTFSVELGSVKFAEN
jgi:hypothetical protein